MMIFFSVCIQQWQAMKVDAEVYWNKRGGHSWVNDILYVFITHGWHIMILFRLGKIIYAFPVPVVSHILKIAFQIIWFFVTTFYGVWLDLSNNIGKGFYIGHFGGIIVRGDFGDHCSIGQGVTIGTKGAGKSDGYPVFANNVYVGAGAKIIGNISLGDNVVVGANAVVTKSVPSDSLVIGVPANFRPIN